MYIILYLLNYLLSDANVANSVSDYSERTDRSTTKKVGFRT